jgi:hypothetical protein
MKYKNKAITLLELIIASLLILVVVAGTGVLFNFIQRRSLITRAKIDIRLPAQFALSHIQRSVMDSGSVDLVNPSGSTSAIISLLPSHKRYEFDSSNKRVLYYPDYQTNPGQSEVLAKNISKLEFQDGQDPAKTTSIILLQIALTASDPKGLIDDFSIQTKAFSRCVGPSFPFVYNKTQEKGYTTGIQAAIADAKLNGWSNNEIRASGGVFNENLTIDINVVLKGGYDPATIKDDESVGPPPYPPRVQETIIDGGGKETSVITYTNCAGSLDKFTIQNGSAVNGGGINATNNCTVAISNCNFNNNHATNPPAWTPANGGAIYCKDSPVSLSDCTISSNEANGANGGAYGGGMYFDSSDATILRCTISSNSAVTSSGNAVGGGVYIRNSSGLTMTDCTIDGNEAGWLGGGLAIFGQVDFSTTPPTITDGSTCHIINCRIINNSAREAGGVLCYNGGSPIISGGSISGNTAETLGGGIYVGGYCNPRIGETGDENQVVISRNTAGGGELFLAGSGGGIVIWNFGRRDNFFPTFTNCLIGGDTGADANQAKNGAGINCKGSAEFYDCKIKNNRGTTDAPCGGGIYIQPMRDDIDITVRLERCEIIGNHADSPSPTGFAQGGGIYCIGYQNRTTELILSECTIRQNSSNVGGGIALRYYVSLIASQCDISQNEFYTGGGGISCHFSSTATLSNCIIANHTSTEPFSAGILCTEHWALSNPPGNQGATCEFTNCTITQNNRGIKWDDDSDSTVTIINSVIKDNTNNDLAYPASLGGVSYSDFDGGITGAPGQGLGNIDVAPIFVDAANGDYHLQSGSLCINAGNPDLGYNDPDGTPNDMGAYGGPGGNW